MGPGSRVKESATYSQLETLKLKTEALGMDYLAHGIWSYNIFHRLRNVGWAVFFGVLPDTLSWVPYVFYRIFTGQFAFGKPAVDQIPPWVFTLYGISHSAIVAAGVIVLLWFVVKPFPWYVLAWPLHIAIDLFTHRREFLPTPFLWPVSDWAFPGISWAEPWFMVVNYTLMLGVLIYVLTRCKRPAR